MMLKRSRARKPIPSDSTPEERALDFVALRRRGYTAKAAAAVARTDPRTVRRHAAQAFRKSGRRWVVTRYDRIPRRVTALTKSGPLEDTFRDSRTVSLLAQHANAVRTYLETGDERPLRKLRRRRIRVRGVDLDLEVDPVRLDRLAAGGELHYELYRT